VLIIFLIVLSCHSYRMVPIATPMDWLWMWFYLFIGRILDQQQGMWILILLDSIIFFICVWIIKNVKLDYIAMDIVF